MSAETDEQLMLAYANGDAAAFDVLYGRHRGPLYRYVLRSITDTATAQELYQDIWLKVIDARARYEASAKFTTWLYRIARNRVVDEYRRNGRSLEVVDTDIAERSGGESDNPARDLTNSELRGSIAQALEVLPLEQREVFLFKEEQGFSLQQIAEITGSNVETSKSRLRYAIKKLRACLADERTIACETEGLAVTSMSSANSAGATL